MVDMTFTKYPPAEESFVALTANTERGRAYLKKIKKPDRVALSRAERIEDDPTACGLVVAWDTGGVGHTVAL